MTDPRHLDAVNRLIHDYWFDVGDIVYDAERRTLRLKFLRPSETGGQTIRRFLFFRRVRVPITEWWLEIRNVDSQTVQESEGIGRYDFNELEFSEVNRTLIVKTGVPLMFQLAVTALDVGVGDTRKVVEEKSCTTL